MKNGIVAIASFYIDCPHCGVTYENDFGSRLNCGAHSGDAKNIVTCGYFQGAQTEFGCGKKYKVPKYVRENLS